MTAFLYERLSRDDNLEGESYSIGNQKKLLTKVAKEKNFYDDIESDLFLFIVKAKIIVTIALAVHEKNALSHTPLSCHIGVRINKKPIGNTSVPKNEVIRERAGRSSAVK